MLTTAVVGVIVLSLAFLAPEHHMDSGCEPIVNAFLGQPNRENFVSLKSGGTICWQTIVSSEMMLDHLDELAEHGDRWAAEYLATHLKQLDGAYLEDALIAVGVFSEHDMRQFLIFSSRGLLSKRELSSSLIMLPLSMSDDPGGQLKRLNARRRKVLLVSSGQLATEKAEALKAIDDAATEIRSTE